MSLQDKRDSIAARLDTLRADAETIIAREDFNPESDLYRSLKTDADTLTAQLREIDEALIARATTPALSIPAAPRPTEPDTATLGELVVRAGTMDTYQGSGRHTLIERAPLFIDFGTGSPKPFAAPSRISISEPGFLTPLLNAVSPITIASNSYEWVSYGIPSDAEDVEEGDLKPEATLSAELVSGSLDTVAHWAEASRQLLEDSSAAAGFIDGSLRRGVISRMEAKVAAALTGGSYTNAIGATLIAAIRNGVGTVQAAGYTPNIVVMNPADWANLDIAVMGSTLGGPNVNGQFWGLTPVASSAVTAGTAYVGNLADAMVLLTRGQVAVYITDSHGENFTSNIFTILAETRCKALVSRADAIAECFVD